MDSTKRAETADQTPLPYEANALNILFVSCLELAYISARARRKPEPPATSPAANHVLTTAASKKWLGFRLFFIFSRLFHFGHPRPNRRPGEFTLYLAHRPDICFDPRFEVKCHLLGFQPKAALAFFSISITIIPRV